MPRVSVIMPVRDGKPYLGSAVQSILDQTYRDLELIVIDDGSRDGAADTLHAFKDDRLRILTSPPIGITAALNLGIGASNGIFIARMDADDIAHPSRLAVQLACLDENPEVGLVCSNARVINGEGETLGAERETWPSRQFVRQGLLMARRMKPIIHPSVVVRRPLIEAVGGYRNYAAAEDRDLWLRLIPLTEFTRLQGDLLDYRVHSMGISRQKSETQALSTAMAVVNSMLVERHGVDLYTDNPVLFEKVRSELAEHMTREAVPMMIRLQEVKARLRGRRLMAALASFAAASIRQHQVLTPDSPRRKTYHIVEQAVVQAGEFLRREQS